MEEFQTSEEVIIEILGESQYEFTLYINNYIKEIGLPFDIPAERTKILSEYVNFHNQLSSILYTLDRKCKLSIVNISKKKSYIFSELKSDGIKSSSERNELLFMDNELTSLIIESDKLIATKDYLNRLFYSLDTIIKLYKNKG